MIRVKIFGSDTGREVMMLTILGYVFDTRTILNQALYRD